MTAPLLNGGMSLPHAMALRKFVFYCRKLDTIAAKFHLIIMASMKHKLILNIPMHAITSVIKAISFAIESLIKKCFRI